MLAIDRSIAPDDMPQEGSLQRRTLAAYLSMIGFAPAWARRLVMLSGSDDAAPFALATLAAGGAVLWIGADGVSLRESSLEGLIDFQVTTLSEALRILKNEIRKGLPVSVGVLDAERRIWSEAAERGVQPHALLAGAEDAAPAEVLVARGAFRLDKPLASETWEEHALTWQQRRAGDEALAVAAEELPDPERAAAQRWLRAAPRLFPRDRVRCYAGAWKASKDNV